jgi:hypothetical protein
VKTLMLMPKGRRGEGEGGSGKQYWLPPQPTWRGWRGSTRKASSTTCQRAFLPLNRYKRHIFWNHNYPLGQANVQMQDMIDVDEAGFKIESTNPGFGKTVLLL